MGTIGGNSNTTLLSNIDLGELPGVDKTSGQTNEAI